MRGRSWEKTVEDTSLTVKQEIKEIDYAMRHHDDEFLAQYGGFGAAHAALRGTRKTPRSEAHGGGLD